MLHFYHVVYEPLGILKKITFGVIDPFQCDQMFEYKVTIFPKNYQM